MITRANIGDVFSGHDRLLHISVHALPAPTPFFFSHSHHNFLHSILSKSLLHLWSAMVYCIYSSDKNLVLFVIVFSVTDSLFSLLYCFVYFKGCYSIYLKLYLTYTYLIWYIHVYFLYFCFTDTNWLYTETLITCIFTQLALVLMWNFYLIHDMFNIQGCTSLLYLWNAE
jgi:uncharacterized membrane protein